MTHKEVGDHAEDLASRFLINHGLQLLARNFRCRRGEIDLIMRDGDSLVFIEVRYRQRTRYGRAVETVSRTKQTRIIYCAQNFILRHHAWNVPARFDVVSIEGRSDDLNIEWLKDAFRLDS